MLFNSLQYIVFLIVVVSIYWVVPKRLRTILLLVSSYYFYMSWISVYALILGLLSVVNYLLGIAIYKEAEKQRKRLYLIAGLAVNLGCLCLYKYTDFLLETVWHLQNFVYSIMPALPPPAKAIPALGVLLPLGISFFVFEFIHYLVDIFRANQPIYSPIRFGLFAAFFPSQIAGPIKRYEDFDSQLDRIDRFDHDLFISGMWLILQGMFKKVVLGDNLAALVQQGFSHAAQMGTMDAWIATLAFTFQIYFDFSGYTDIGRGSAMLMGFQLPENFNLPYLADSLRDFWRRWHISLSTWLRDYLYISLGGSKAHYADIAKNLIITMLLGGLWHGASWHFVVWGGFHGLGLAVNRFFDEIAKKHAFMAKLVKTPVFVTLCWALTFLFVVVGWVLFRAENLFVAADIYTAMFSAKASAFEFDSVTNLFKQSSLLVTMPLYAILQLSRYYILPALIDVMKTAVGSKQHHFVSWWMAPPASARLVGVIGMAVLILGFASYKSMPFIYFQF